MKQPVSKATRCVTALWLSILLAAAGGCGKRATVTGKVTYQGRPVTYGSVIFLSADNTARSAAIAGDGSYRVEGVPLGAAKIAVISHDPSKGRSVVRGSRPARGDNHAGTASKGLAAGWFPLPPRFEDTMSSGLGCEVDSGRLHYEIEMK
jgi:hypothetical protein